MLSGVGSRAPAPVGGTSPSLIFLALGPDSPGLREGATRFRPVAAELVGPFDVGASGGGIVGAGSGPKDVGLLVGGGRMVGGAGGAGGGTDCPARRISVGVADEDTAREAAAGPRSCEQR